MTPATPSFGDSLNVMTEQLAAASVDLIYLDPPFNSKRDYNMLLRGKAQASVFQDTWRWSLRCAAGVSLGHATGCRWSKMEGSRKEGI